MITKEITHENYEGDLVTGSFSFHFSKLEAIEMEMTSGGLEALVKRLTETKDGPAAYNLFKQFLLDAYGERSVDGKRFDKDADIRKNLANSPALGELILHFLQHPEEAAAFMEGTLPAGLVKEMKANGGTIPPPLATPQDAPVAPETPAVKAPEPTPEPVAKEKTDDELLAMKPQDMTPEELRRAYSLKTGV